MGTLSLSTERIRPREDPGTNLPVLKSIGGRRVLRRLGVGGMSEVYLAYDEKIHRQVAIKVLPDDLAQSSNYVRRFQREADLGHKLIHPNIVRCIESGQDPVTLRWFLVMEFVKGQSAQTLLERQGPFSLADAIRVCVDIARGLEELHHHNFVHRDVKPGNILVGEDGKAKLADLGVAKLLQPGEVELTSWDQGIGTPFYMPWEQTVNASLVDPRSDLFSLGATLYHLITGRVPFPGQVIAEVAHRKEVGKFASVREINPKLPRSLDTILEKLMAKMPEHRFQTATELIDALRASGLNGESELGSRMVETEMPPPVTRPDLKIADKQQQDARKAKLWTYQYRHGSGWKRGRAPIQSIIGWYESGAIPEKFYVAPPGQRTCRYFRTIAEFRDIKRKTTLPAETPTKEPEAAATRRTRRNLGRLFLVVALALFLTAAASLVLHLVIGGE